MVLDRSLTVITPSLFSLKAPADVFLSMLRNEREKRWKSNPSLWALLLIVLLIGLLHISRGTRDCWEKSSGEEFYLLSFIYWQISKQHRNWPSTSYKRYKHYSTLTLTQPNHCISRQVLSHIVRLFLSDRSVCASLKMISLVNFKLTLVKLSQQIYPVMANCSNICTVLVSLVWVIFILFIYYKIYY